jgi:pimeloyl-ACP methyl ester carboxylesterase
MRRRCRRLSLSALALAALAACARHAPPPPAAAAPAAATGSAPAAAARDAGPHITLSPDSVHIEYRLYGHGDPAVLLVHGWAADANYWNAQIEPLAARYTVAAINLAGHGASGSNRSDWSIANYARDVAAVAHELPNAHLALVGHAMGAAVVLSATPLLGSRVIGVVVVEALRSAGMPPPSAAEIERRVAPFSADFIGETRKLVSASLFPRGADAVLVQKVAYDMSLEPQAIAIASMRALLAFDLRGVLPAIHVPVYAINSDLAPTDAARIRKLLPDFTLDVLEHGSHFPMLDAPARFNPLLLRDLAAISARAPH